MKASDLILKISMKEIKLFQNEEWEKNYIGLLRTNENERILNYYEKSIGYLFVNEKSCPKVLDFLEKSKYGLNLEEREGKSLQFIKIKDKYYDSMSGLHIGNIKLKKLLDLTVYEEVDLDEGKRLAIKNLTSIIKGELSLGDKKLIKDIALENFYFNLKNVIKKEDIEIWNWVSCVRTDLHSWPVQQLFSYGFEIEDSSFYDVRL